MNISRRLLSIAFISVILLSVFPSTVAAGNPPTVTLLNPLPAELAVGETYMLDIRVESDQPFTLTTAQIAPQFPAYVHGNGGDRAQQASTAVLHVPLIGVRPTAKLPGGADAIRLVVATRYGGGLVIVNEFNFSVVVR